MITIYANMIIRDCASCGHNHNELEVNRLDHTVDIDGEVYDMATVCPTTGEKIYVRILAECEEQ